MQNVFKKKLFITILAFIANLYANNDVCFELEDNPYPNHPAFGVFSRYVNVLDCIEIYAEANISDEKILHVAAVAAELLDNDEDGNVDDPLIESSLIEFNTVMPIFQSENGNAIETFFNNLDEDGCTGAVVFRNEIDPDQPGHWGDDATVEEVLHTINACGHVEVYPELYALEPNSSYLTDAMDVARGGQFITFPDTYPEDSWYHYDDWTCDYECMAMEYLYWCIVTNMDILSDPQTCAGIANEWELCSPQLFENTDTLMFNLVTDLANKLPQLAPDGNYCPSNVDVKKKNSPNAFIVFPSYPNPFNPTTMLQYDLPEDGFVNIRVYDIKGMMVRTLFNDQQIAGYKMIQWDAKDDTGNQVSTGVYLYQIDYGGFRHIKKMIFLK